MKRYLSLLAVPLFCIATAMPAYSGIKLTLSDNRVLNVDLAEARLISELSGYAIIAGRSCVDCDENTAIYLEKIDRDRQGSQAGSRNDGEPPEPEEFAALGEEDDRSDASASDRAQADTDGIVDMDLSGERYSYPGEYRDYLTKEPVEKTRMFYGNCHENSPALLWLTEYRTEKGWEKEELLLVFREEGVEHRYNESLQPSIYYIENERCRELPGITVTTEP